MRNIFATMLVMAVSTEARRSKEGRVDFLRSLDHTHHHHDRRELLDSVEPHPQEVRGGIRGVPSEFIADTEEEEFLAFIKWSSHYGKEFKDSDHLNESMAQWKIVN